MILVAGACGGRTDHEGNGDDLFVCADNSDCIVVPQTCCGSCGAATRGDAIAINRDQTSAWSSRVCDGTDTACPACYRPPDRTLVATCEAARCTLIDLNEHASTECMQDSDCRVRTHECCECGGDTSPQQLIAVSSETGYSALVCDADQACPECAPIYPPEVAARCDGDHCVVDDPRSF